MSNVKDELHQRIDRMTEEEALDLLDMINLQDEPDTLSPEDETAALEAGAEVRRGEYVSLEDLRRKLDGM